MALKISLIVGGILSVFFSCGMLYAAKSNPAITVDRDGTVSYGPATAKSTITATGMILNPAGATYRGNVGIGITLPAYQLHISSVVPTLAIVSGTGQSANILFRTTVNMWQMSKNGNNDFTLFDYLGTAGNRLIIKSQTGFMGLGTNAPAAMLDISSGTIHMAGTGVPTPGYALCFTTGGLMGHCSTSVGADGSCSCGSP